MRLGLKFAVALGGLALLAAGCSGGTPTDAQETPTTSPAPPSPNALLPCPDLTTFALIPEADRTAYLTTEVPCDRPDLWEQMGRQLFRQAENPICGYGTDPPRLRVGDAAAAEILRNQLPSNIRDDMEIELGCPRVEPYEPSNEPDLRNEAANTIAREMLEIGARLGVFSFSVAVNPDDSIHICIWDSQLMADETAKRARELEIEATVSTDCNRPVAYGS